MGVGQRYSRFAAFSMGKGFWTSPSFLWKEVPRRGGGWLPQRDERECEIVHPRFVIPSAALDLSCRRENSTYEEVRHSKSYEVRCLPLISHSPFHRCARKISRLRSKWRCGEGATLIFRLLETYFPSLFHTASALSAPTGHLPLEGKAIHDKRRSRPLHFSFERVSFYFFSQYATCVSAAPMPRAVLMPMPVYMAKEARVAARLAAMSFLKKP